MADGDVLNYSFPDGTLINYSPGLLTIEVHGDIRMHATENIEIKADGSVEIRAGEGIDIDAGGDANIRAGGSIGVTAGANITMKGALISLN